MNASAARLGGTVLLALCALQARAADAPTSPPPATDDGLAAAQADYQAIKSSNRPAVQQSLELPRLPAPVLPAGTEVAPPPPVASITLRREADAAEKQRRAQERAKNWLVEGVLGPKATDPTRTTGDASSDLLAADRTETSETHSRLDANAPTDDNRNSDRTTSSRRSGPAAKDQSDRSTADREKRSLASTAANPLDRYMAEWMTPNDRSLLLASGSTRPADDPAATILGPSASGGAPAADGQGSPSGVLAFTDFASPVRSTTPSSPAENPYLTAVAPALDPATFDPPPPPATTAPAPIFSPLPAGAPPPATAPSDSLIDQLKARDEADRAFKQLKRF